MTSHQNQLALARCLAARLWHVWATWVVGPWVGRAPSRCVRECWPQASSTGREVALPMPSEYKLQTLKPFIEPSNKRLIRGTGISNGLQPFRPNPPNKGRAFCPWATCPVGALVSWPQVLWAKVHQSPWRFWMPAIRRWVWQKLLMAASPWLSILRENGVLFFLVSNLFLFRFCVEFLVQRSFLFFLRKIW